MTSGNRSFRVPRLRRVTPYHREFLFLANYSHGRYSCSVLRHRDQRAPGNLRRQCLCQCRHTNNKIMIRQPSRGPCWAHATHITHSKFSGASHTTPCVEEHHTKKAGDARQPKGLQRQHTYMGSITRYPYPPASTQSQKISAGTPALKERHGHYF